MRFKVRRKRFEAVNQEDRDQELWEELRHKVPWMNDLAENAAQIQAPLIQWYRPLEDKRAQYYHALLGENVVKAVDPEGYPVLLPYAAWLESGGEPLGPEYQWGVMMCGDKVMPLGPPEEEEDGSSDRSAEAQANEADA